MRENYNIGSDTNEIKVEVKIGTPGLAHTIIFLFPPEGGHNILKESDVDSGNVEETFVGTGGELVGGYLQIRTVVDFGAIDSSQWEQLGNTIFCEYLLTGGLSGSHSYSCDTDDKSTSNNGRIVVIDKFIDFTQ